MPPPGDFSNFFKKSDFSEIGQNQLGFSKEDIGLHSIRSGGAMAIFLSGVSSIIIKRIGRWSSEAFLEYIREQIEKFTAGVSQKYWSSKTSII